MRHIGIAMALTLGALPLTAQARPDTTKRPVPVPKPVVTTGYGAWFGSIPEMNSTSAGVTLAGVTDGSPAAKAGLKKGDLIISMAEVPVVDLRAMVEILRAHPPGDTISVVYIRDVTEQKVKVVLGTRP